MQLEVRNLIKKYPIKGGTFVNALNGVSLKFPETGLIFVLGKSGSGKSTLLNVMGGLDKADEGEIIINGKSSKDFNGSEMDSYRNTYLGFIFQEYNILNDFTVKENIALALELQHKKADSEAIAKILDEVDLAGHEKRKPNQLSGGQKQRVAIARALVKNPEIIFADEPTGALDSNTGKQVFDTLKKLARTRLVIVVSHDRDFAEYYGDRVIELKDGEVISDIVKVEVKAKPLNDKVQVLKQNLLRIEPGYQLTSADVNYINSLLKDAKTNAYVSLDSRVNNSIVSSAMISETGNVQAFKITDNDEIEFGNEEFKVVKSKFPNKDAIRMGAKSLRVKPVRLIFTILLSVLAFTFFGVSITASLTTKADIVSSAIIENGETSLVVQSSKNYTYEVVTDELLETTNQKTGGSFRKFYNSQENISLGLVNAPTEDYSSSTGGKSYYFTTNVRTVLVYNDVKDLGFNIIYGKEPTSDGEILITKHILESFENYDCDGLTKEQVSADPTAILGHTLGSYTIVGVLDTKLDLAKFQDYKDGIVPTSQLYSSLTSQVLNQYNSLDFHGSIYTYSAPTNSNCAMMIARTNNNHNFIKKVANLVMEDANNPKNDGYRLRNTVGSYAMSIAMLLDVFVQVFLTIGIIFAVFAVLLFYNFISISINNRRREIGILRAVGARGMDVFKIFFSESGIIALINFTISSVATLLSCSLINNLVASNDLIAFNLLFPSVLTFGAILLIAFASGFVASFLPTMRLAHQKPIDAIREK